MAIEPPRLRKLTAPTLLTARHEVGRFDCGVEALNIWLRKKALGNQSSGAARAYVTSIDDDVVGCYALSTGAIGRDEAAKKIARNMPDPVPVLLLGRLAVHVGMQGQGVGADLLQDALARSLQAADIVGVRAVLLHAKDAKAASFYRHFGFVPSPVSDRTMMVTIEQIRSSLP